MHLQPRSLRVAKGDRVRRGQVLGLVGNSGDSFLPHLHFHVSTEPGMTGQGLPYLIEPFSIIDPSGAPQLRARELPLDTMVVDFGS
jgi:murein DD-endopeptidase MepM/ murein hydrolase activator NlpD